MSVSDQAERNWLKRAVGQQSAAANVELRLFTNTPPSAEAAVIGDFTEPTELWYPGATVLSLAAVQTVAGETYTDNAEIVYTLTQDYTAETIYGFFLKDAGSGELLGFKAFAQPRVLQWEDDFLAVTPRILCD